MVIFISLVLVAVFDSLFFNFNMFNVPYFVFFITVTVLSADTEFTITAEISHNSCLMNRSNRIHWPEVTSLSSYAVWKGLCFLATGDFHLDRNLMNRFNRIHWPEVTSLSSYTIWKGRCFLATGDFHLDRNLMNRFNRIHWPEVTSLFLGMSST